MKKKTIEKLTPEQESKFEFYADKWLKIGLSTEPANRAEAEDGVRLTYECAKLSPPKSIVWVDSPKELSNKRDNPNENLSYMDVIFGQHDANWLAYYDFFRTECGLVEETENLKGLEKVALNAGWWIPYDDIVYISERPVEINMDNENLLHSESGPSVMYRDGFSVYTWHGVRIPKEWIEDKDSLTPEMALKWENIEQRRVACEILGWDNILNHLNPVIIDEDDPEIGELLEVDIPDSGKERFLRVLCGTGRTFALPVPPEMKTALEASAWTYGLESDINNYIPEVRT